MQSYIAIHNFMPRKKYPNNEEIKEKINIAINNLKDKNNEKLELDPTVRENIENKVFTCMQEYNKLTGVTEDVINDYIKHSPAGLLPQFTTEVLGYFSNLESKSTKNKEITILEYSGIKEIKIRYKHADSVIKKLVKIGNKDITKLKDPLGVFLKNGALHDLIGIQFVCFYPYQAKWLARSLYNFFNIPHRTDDHLLYGFYQISRDSGYKGLHCDFSDWNPRFDQKYSDINDNVDEKIYTSNDIDTLKNLIKSNGEGVKDILYAMRKVFNIEIQIHTAFESAWAKMEHEKSYDILSKNSDKGREITVLWKMLSDNLSNLEEQFQNLQVQTEQSMYDEDYQGYGFLSDIIEPDSVALKAYHKSVDRLKDLKEDLENHEISKEIYVHLIEEEASFLQKSIIHAKDVSIIFALKLQLAFMYYSFTNYRKYFNVHDIGHFVGKSIDLYQSIITDLCFEIEYKASSHKSLLVINATIRYGRLMQKNGFGLIDNINAEKKALSSDYNQKTDLEKGIQNLGLGLYYFNHISDPDRELLKKDSSSYFKTIHYFDKLSRDIELNITDDIPIKLFNKRIQISKLIYEFRAIYMNKNLYTDFTKLINDTNKKQIKNTSFIINFLSTLILNNLARPIDALKNVVIFSSYSDIEPSDIFFYEYASYKFLYEKKCEELSDCKEKLSDYVNEDDNHKINNYKCKHYGDYHHENMINLLFRVKKQDIYEFYKARAYFNNLPDIENFKEDHFSNKSTHKCII